MAVDVGTLKKYFRSTELPNIPNQIRAFYLQVKINLRSLAVLYRLTCCSLYLGIIDMMMYTHATNMGITNDWAESDIQTDTFTTGFPHHEESQQSKRIVL
jgi:hypothetical protein